MMVLGLVQGRVRVGRQQRGRRHERVSIVQQRHPGRQGAGEGLGGHLPQRLGLVQQDVLDEEGRGPRRRDGVRGRREVEVHGAGGGEGSAATGARGREDSWPGFGGARRGGRQPRGWRGSAASQWRAGGA